MSQVVSSPSIWILDACSALNFVASGQVEAILRAPVGGQVRAYHIADIVIGEATAVRRGGGGDDAEEREPIDWEAFFTQGWLRREPEPTPLELADFVRLAAQIDDGEAMTLALANSRSYGVVTDDRKAQRLMTVPWVDTPTLLKNWSDETNCDPSVLGAALRQVAERSRFVPTRVHPLKTWWDNASKK